MSNKKEPYRMCIVCRKMKPKSDLLRVVLLQNKVVVDYKQKLGGRGFWLDKSSECIANAKKRKSLNRAFKKEIPEEIYVELESVINAGDSSK